MDGIESLLPLAVLDVRASPVNLELSRLMKLARDGDSRSAAGAILAACSVVSALCAAAAVASRASLFVSSQRLALCGRAGAADALQFELTYLQAGAGSVDAFAAEGASGKASSMAYVRGGSSAAAGALSGAGRLPVVGVARARAAVAAELSLAQMITSDSACFAACLPAHLLVENVRYRNATTDARQLLNRVSPSKGGIGRAYHPRYSRQPAPVPCPRHL